MPGSIQPGRASQRDSPCGVLLGSIVALRRRNSGILAAAAAAAAPCGPVVVHPVEQSGFEADVLSGGLAEAPFVAEDFVAFREVIAVGGGTARGIFAFVVAGGIRRHGWGAASKVGTAVSARAFLPVENPPGTS